MVGGLIPNILNELRTGWSSLSSTTRSPSTRALSLAPAKAAQVLTPVSFPVVQLQGILTVRPMTALNIPSWVSPLEARIVWSGAEEREQRSEIRGQESAGRGAGSASMMQAG